MKKCPSGHNRPENLTPAANAAGVIDVKATTKTRTHIIIKEEYHKTIEKSLKHIMKADGIFSAGHAPETILIELDKLFGEIYDSSSEESRIRFEILKAENIKKSKDPEYEEEYSGIERLTIHETDEKSEVTKLIHFHNGIIRIREKLEEISLFRVFPSLLDSEDTDWIFRKKIKGTPFESIFLKVFGSEEEMESSDHAFGFLDDMDLDEIDIGDDEMDFEDMVIGFPQIPSDLMKKRTYRKYSDLLSGCESMKVDFDSLGIMIHLDDEDYKTVIGDASYGSYIPETVLGFVRDSIGEKEITASKLHERRHNIYHAFFPGGGIVHKDAFMMVFDNIENLIRLQAPEISIRDNFDSLEKKIRGFFLSSQDELIANFEELRNGRLATELSNYIDIINDLKKRKRNIMARKKSSDILVELSAHLDDTINGLSEYYSTFYRRLSDLFYVSKQEGLDKELFASMILFNPLRHDKIERYFRQKIGSDRYDFHCTMRMILKPDFFIVPKSKMSDPFDSMMGTLFGSGNGSRTEKEFKIAGHKDAFSPIRIKRLSLLENIPDMSSEKEKIFDEIYGIDFKKLFFRFKVHGSEKYLRYRRRFLRLMKKIGLDKEELLQIGKQLDGEYVYHLSLHEDRFDLTKDILDNFPAVHDGFLKFIFKEILEDLEENENKKNGSLRRLIMNHPRSKGWFKD